MANYFSINNISIVSPTGSIMAFLGIVDPNGWVIMDGLPRVNSGQYNNLISMGIGTVDVNNDYIPPNYNGAFLRGIGTSPINPLYIGETNAGEYQDMGVMNHSHSVTDPGHAHAITDPSHAHSVYDPGHVHLSVGNYPSGTIGTTWFTRNDTGTGGGYLYPCKQGSDPAATTGGAATGIGIYGNVTGITINSALTGISISTATVSDPSYSATETRPFNYGVNWILKL